MTDASSDGSCWRHLLWIGRLVCGVAAVMAFMAAIPAVASAALTINSVSLARSSGPPGAVLIGGINSSGASGVAYSDGHGY
ncbi:MAG TPA: hypothetical protein VEF89_03965 [Solirubrobacteraceae bacterium]|nr:hypothetical protein [Solirubrobacteraceae bacterium]